MNGQFSRARLRALEVYMQRRLRGDPDGEVALSLLRCSELLVGVVRFSLPYCAWLAEDVKWFCCEVGPLPQESVIVVCPVLRLLG